MYQIVFLFSRYFNFWDQILSKRTQCRVEGSIILGSFIIWYIVLFLFMLSAKRCDMNLVSMCDGCWGEIVDSIYTLRVGIRHERYKLNSSPDCIQTLEMNVQQLAVHEDKGHWLLNKTEIAILPLLMARCQFLKGLESYHDLETSQK